MEDDRDSYLINALLDNYEEPLDISLISNNSFIPVMGNILTLQLIKTMRNDTSYRKALQTYHQILLIKLPLNLNEFRNWKFLLTKNVTS